MDNKGNYKVSLKWYEVFRAALVGMLRVVELIRKNENKEIVGQNGSIDWQGPINQACAELALCKLLNSYWPGHVEKHDQYKDKRQVRVVGSKEKYLIIGNEDPDCATYALMTNEATEYTLTGWIRGNDAKCSEWLIANGDGQDPYYKIPIEKLRSPEELIELKNKKTIKEIECRRSAHYFNGHSVKLKWYEILQATIIGLFREVEAIRYGRRNTAGFDGSFGWQRAEEGACGEVALAKDFELYWQGSINTFMNGGDVGRLEVKTVGLEEHILVIKPRDPINAIFVLVIGKLAEYIVCGWKPGPETRKNEWYRKLKPRRPKAYCVPQEALNNMGELLRMNDDAVLKKLLPLDAEKTDKAT